MGDRNVKSFFVSKKTNSRFCLLMQFLEKKIRFLRKIIQFTKNIIQIFSWILIIYFLELEWQALNWIESFLFIHLTFEKRKKKIGRIHMVNHKLN